MSAASPLARFWSFLKSAGKWTAILGAIYVASLIFNGLDFENRIGWLIFGIAMAVAYLDGRQKDRISDLENRIAELEYRLSRWS